VKPPTPSEVRALRASVGLSQLKLAALLGVSERTWERWETGLTECAPVTWRGVVATLQDLGLLDSKGRPKK
jgi:transcriptional regulator with XRE-family HTH domain